MEIKNRGHLIVGILVAVIVVLLIIVLYGFVVKPKINGFVLNKQIEAQEMVFTGIINQINTQGGAEIPYGNQSIILVPYVPQQTSFQEVE